MVLLVTAILITGVLAMAISASQLSSSRQEYGQALYLAEAGVNALISEWRAQGNPPTQPFTGTLANQSRAGTYQVTWTWPPDEYGVVTLNSQGTANSDSAAGSIFRLTRRVQVRLDTDGHWAWNHVYSTDPSRTDIPECDEYPYAERKGGAGEISPEDPYNDHCPGAFPMLPTPKWNEWRKAAMDAWIAEAKDDGTLNPDTGLPSNYQALTSSGKNFDPNRHVYWYGKSSTETENPVPHAYDANGNPSPTATHTHRNGYIHAPGGVNELDPYFNVQYPDAYVCQTKGSTAFEVVFEGTVTGLYFVHGDVLIKNSLRLEGTIIATGSIRTQGQALLDIQPMVQATGGGAYTVYPAMIAGEDISLYNQSTEHVYGIMWAGRSFLAQASDQYGCVVSPYVKLDGNYNVTYGSFPVDPNDPNSPRYESGSSPPPMFNEPDIGVIQPTPRSWREL